MPMISGVPGADSIKITPAEVDWDAIRVPRHVGLAALNLLSVPHGPVIVDPHERVLYILVPPGTAERWEAPQTQAYGDTTYVMVPPEGREVPPGPYWLLPPSANRPLTDPERLRAAVQTVMGPEGASA